MRDQVTATIATMPSRLRFLERAVGQLLPQVDRLNVYLNNFDQVPEFLLVPKVVIGRSQSTGDLKGAGKFFWAHSVVGYHLTCDDDIDYAPDYVEQMARNIERWQRKAIVGAHGWRLRTPFTSYWKDRAGYHFAGHTEGCFVHGLGTGVMAYHSDTVRLKLSDFAVYNMEDPTLAVLAQRRRIPLWVIPHAKGWLAPTYLGDDTVFNNSNGSASNPDPAKDVGKASTETILCWPNWQVNELPTACL